MKTTARATRAGRGRQPMPAKERFIRQHAAARGLRLLDIQARCGCARSVFYRVVRGVVTSARVDRVIARTLGVKAADLISEAS